MKRLALCLPIISQSATAHEWDTLTIDSLIPSRSGNYLLVNISDTNAGTWITCAGYTESGVLVSVQNTIANNLATQVRLDNAGNHISNVSCVIAD